MGSKYSSQSVSGFDSSPPVDDGSATEANKVKWSTIKNKLASPLKTHAEAINTALVTALDKSCRAVTANDAAAASDHEKTIQVNTSSVTITLADAATMAAGYTVSVANNSSGNITVALATATDTIDTVTNTTQTIFPNETRRYIVNAAATGYLTASDRRRKLPTRQVFTSGTGTYVTPTGCTWILVRMVGAGGGGAGSGASGGTGDAGGNTTFGASLTASGGAARAGAVGTGTGGDINISGTRGGNTANSTADNIGGVGGGTVFGPGGAGGEADGGTGVDAAANTGAGGGGAGNSTTPAAAEAGGSGGGYVEKLITSPSASYAYAVGASGAGGVAGTNGGAGGDGGSGIIIVDEHYT
jgi:hypothetical protein